MNSPALQKRLIWFQRRNYKVVALNPLLREPVKQLEQAIERGILARPDLNRVDFYDVDLPDGWSFIHVREDARVVYLVACNIKSVGAGFTRMCAPIGAGYGLH